MSMMRAYGDRHGRPPNVIRDCWGMVAVYGGDDSVMADVDDARARRPTRSPLYVGRGSSFVSLKSEAERGVRRGGSSRSP